MTAETTPARCSYIATCPMFAALSLKASLTVWRTMYCESSPQRCQRLIAFHAGAPCPDNLLPNGKLIKGPLTGIEPQHLS